MRELGEKIRELKDARKRLTDDLTNNPPATRGERRRQWSQIRKQQGRLDQQIVQAEAELRVALCRQVSGR